MSIKFLTWLTVIAWFALIFFTDLSFMDLTIAAIIIVVAAMICGELGRETNQRDDETNEEYEQRIKQADYDLQIGETSYLVSKTVNPLVEVYGLEKIWTFLRSLRLKDFWDGEDILDLASRYELDDIEDVLLNLHEKRIFVGAHKIEVEAIMGKPDHIREGGRSEDWCYEPSKSGKRFGKRITFKGDYVYDFRV